MGNSNFTPKTVNIQRKDFFSLPDFCRRIVSGKPFVLATVSGQSVFVPAVIL